MPDLFANCEIAFVYLKDIFFVKLPWPMWLLRPHPSDVRLSLSHTDCVYDNQGEPLE